MSDPELEHSRVLLWKSFYNYSKKQNKQVDQDKRRNKYTHIQMLIKRASRKEQVCEVLRISVTEQGMQQALIFYLYFYILKSLSEERGAAAWQKSFGLATKSAFLQWGTHSHIPSLGIALKCCRGVQKTQEHWSESSLFVFMCWEKTLQRVSTTLLCYRKPLLARSALWVCFYKAPHTDSLIHKRNF